MSEDRGNGGAPPSTFSDMAHAMYGPEPIQGVADPRAKQLIESGIARSSEDRPAGPDSRSPGQAFDAARLQNFDAADPLMGAFSTTAKQHNLSHQAAEALLGLHSKALSAQQQRLDTQWNDWYVQSQREFGSALPQVVDDIKSVAGEDAAAQEFYRLLSWSGLEYNPSVIKILSRLARNGRY
jgi:hypothetical protein